jgi:hypothetical protein
VLNAINLTILVPTLIDVYQAPGLQGFIWSPCHTDGTD